MIINILDKDTFLSNNAWSIQFFLPKEELIISDDYRFVQLKDIVCERKGYTSFVTVECDVNYIGLENIESKTVDTKTGSSLLLENEEPPYKIPAHVHQAPKPQQWEGK